MPTESLPVGLVVSILSSGVAAVGNAYAMPARLCQLTWQNTGATGSINCDLLASLDNVTYDVIDSSTVLGEVRTLETAAAFIKGDINALGGGTAVIQVVARA